MKKRNAPRPGLSTRLVRAGVAGLVSVAAIAGLASGCLDRPICPDPDHPDQCSPAVKNVFVTNLVQSSVDKIDLLFMIDNSASMADKQDLLGKAVPELVSRLVNPICVDKSGVKGGAQPTDITAPCDAGFEREFSPIKDIHVGVVTSSLGGHGAVICTPAWGQWNADGSQDDKGHLLGLTRPALTASTFQGQGFLAWDPAGKYTTPPPPNESVPATFGTDFTNMVKAAGESGCGYEASLEAWYRFLADPNPPDQITEDQPSQTTVVSGTDQELLTERANFLRSDSLLAVVMLTDENDCSVADTGLGWLVGRDGALPSATTICKTDPNNQCCHSCGLPDPAGCQHDSICDTQPSLPGAQDAVNLRCWDQKRRFGIATDPSHPEAGLLYPTQRYSNALGKTIICPNHLDLSCGPNDQGVPNPLFTDLSGSGKAVRGPDLVFFAGITGVPWQDIATDATLTDPAKLRYLTSQELTDTGRWDVILGDPAMYKQPTDPLMQESVLPRSGTNPILAAETPPDPRAALVPPGTPSPMPTANAINGHEWSITGADDLQYACTFPLDTPKDCSDPAKACDCGSGQAGDKPLCQDPTTGAVAATATQYYAKGYPGLRTLEVLKEYGPNSIVASICPKIQDVNNPDYGYNPAVSAIIDRLKAALNGKCLPRQLDADPATGLVPCAVVEALGANQSQGLDCSRAGRIDLNTVGNGDLIRAAVKKQLKSLGVCDVAGQPACATYLMCEINQFDPNTQADGLNSCQNADPPGAQYSGYCYVADNAQQHIGSPDLLSKCSATEKQLLRFIGGDANAPLPAAGATYFIACTGASFNTGGGTPAPDGG